MLADRGGVYVRPFGELGHDRFGSTQVELLPDANGVALIQALYVVLMMGAWVTFKVFLQHSSKLVSAIHYLALALMPAAELKVLNRIIRHIQQRDQSNLFFFALGSGLGQQCNRIASFDKPLSRKKGDMLKVIVAQAPRVITGHDVVAP